MQLENEDATPDGSAPVPEVIDESLSETTLDLVRQAAARFGWPRVRVRPLSRYGYSGARVLVIRRDLDRSMPHALKIAEQGEVDVEMLAIGACTKTVKHMSTPEYFTSAIPDDGRSWGAICYEYFGASATKNPADLTDVYAACMGQPTERYPAAATSPESCETELMPLLHDTLEQLDAAHQVDPDLADVTYGELFSSHLRVGHPNRLERVICGAGRFVAYDEVIDRSPLDGLHALLSETSTRARAVLVHGDLHLSNIVVDGTRRANLIDFKWAQVGGHIFLDFVLLESSMRYMGFPHDVHPRLVLAIDQELNSDFDGGEAERIIQKVGDKFTRHRLREMLRMVLFVRARARAVLFEWSASSWSEYQRVLFLVLAGQQRLASFPLMRTIVNLHQLRAGVGL